MEIIFSSQLTVQSSPKRDIVNRALALSSGRREPTINNQKGFTLIYQPFTSSFRSRGLPDIYQRHEVPADISAFSVRQAEPALPALAKGEYPTKCGYMRAQPRRGFTLISALLPRFHRGELPDIKAQPVGFTLIELLITIAVFSVLAVLGTDLFTSFLQGTNKAQVVAEVKQNGQLTLEKAERFIRSSTNVVPQGTSRLNLTQRSGGDVVLEFVDGCRPPGCAGPKSNGKIQTIIGSTTQDLTNTDVVNGIDVISATFSVTSSGGPQIVEIKLTLSQAVSAPSRKDFVAQVDLETTATTRTY